MKLLTVEQTSFQHTSGFFDKINILGALAWARVVLYSAGYVGMILLQLLQGEFLCMAVWQPVHIIMMCAFCLQVFFVEMLNRKQHLNVATYVLFGFDFVLISALVFTFGVNHSVFLFLILLFVAAASFSTGLWDGLKFGLWASALFHIVLLMGPLAQSENLVATFAIQNMAIFVVASLGGYLGEQVQYVSVDIQRKTEQIRTLTDINELIVDNIPSGLFVLDRHFKIERANRGAAKIFSDLSLEGRLVAEVFPALHAELELFLAQYQKSNFKRLELNYLNYKNEKNVIEVILSPIVRNASEFNLQFLCLMQNLTEIKNLEFAMQQKEKLAAVGQLAAGIAHEIRNPLASISGSVQLLQGSLSVQTPEDKKLLAIVVREIDRLNNLITEFLDYVRPDVRAEDPIQLNVLVKEVLEMVKLNEKVTKNVVQRLELRCQGVVYGHYDKLKQALLNIVINAYQAMSDTLRPEITIQTYDAESQIVLVIQDNGVGMSKENLKRIFEPFHTTKVGGTGLGLAITHKIIETHRAQVFVDSELGHGAKFSIVFPSGQSPDSNRMVLKKQA